MLRRIYSGWRWLWQVGLILGLVWAGWWIFFGIASGIVEGLDFVGVLIHTALPGLIFLASVMVAWRWKAIGGIVLIVEGLSILIALPIAFTGFPLLTIVLAMGLPPLIAGVLFVLSWRGERLSP